MSYIEITSLSQRYENTLVIQDLSLNVDKGEFVSLCGPNGCGKTTILRVLAGEIVNDPDGGVFVEGTVTIGGKPPQDARKGMVLQNYDDALFPWRRNLDNIALPFELHGMAASDRYEAVTSLMHRLGISCNCRGARPTEIMVGDSRINLESYPYQLSGGQKQIVSLLMALANAPDVLLMDEPFSSIDYQNTLRLLEVYSSLVQSTDTTIIFVSHKIDEAIFLSDRVIFLMALPTRVKTEMPVPLPRTRTLAVFEDQRFLDLRSAAFKVFRETISA